MKISADKFSEEIKKILNEYSDKIVEETDKVSDATVKQAVKDLKAISASSFGGKGDYAKGWRKKKVQTSSLKNVYTIYNTKPGLTHLLENGHAMRQGGRFDGKKHISVVEKTTVENYKKAIKEIIQNA